MDKKNLMPQQAEPVNRLTTGQLPSELAELSEEALQLHGDGDDSTSVIALAANSDLGGQICWSWVCAYDGEEAE